MADKYQIAQLISRCEGFVLHDFKVQKMEETTVLTMLKTAASARDFSKDALAVLIGRVATFDAALLKAANLLTLPAKVINALHFAKHDFSTNDTKVLANGKKNDSTLIVPSASVDMQLLQ